MQRIVVDCDTIPDARLERAPDPAALAEGEVLLRIESFALTVNNVTYAASGRALKYWDFFPLPAAAAAQDGPARGIVPVWGTAHVAQSRSAHLPEGTRVYGFLPMADSLVIRPEARAPGVVLDASPHRAHLSPVYNSYSVVKGEPGPQDHLRALWQPLLATSYLLSDWLQDQGCFEADQIIIGSASSKTGLGLCHFLSEVPDRAWQIIGLTSAGNRDFVAGLGTCDRVLRYDQIADLDTVASVYVDMAGHAGVKRRLHRHLHGVLRHSAAVGTSHWQDYAPPRDLPGPRPEFFFAPAQIEKRRQDWGAGRIESEISSAWRRVAAASGAWLQVHSHQGLESVPQLWSDLAAGRVAPHEGHVVLP